MSLLRHLVSEESYHGFVSNFFLTLLVTYFQVMTFSAGTYFALPLATLQSTLVVLSGVGIRTTTFVADSLLLKLVLTVTTYETCVVPISLTVGMTRNGSLIFDVERYLMIC